MNPDAVRLAPCPTGVVERPIAMPEGAVGDINSTAKGTAARYNAGKAPLDLIPFQIIADLYAARAMLPSGSDKRDLVAVLERLGQFQETGRRQDLLAAFLALGPLKETLEACARVFAYGKKKYAAWNWAKGMAWSIPLACAGRHIVFGLLAGEETDPESGESHIGHVACNIVMELVFLRNFPEGNDLPSPELFKAAA